MTFDDIALQLNDLTLDESGRITPEECPSNNSSLKSSARKHRLTKAKLSLSSVSSSSKSPSLSPEPTKDEEDLFGIVISTIANKIRLVQTCESKENNRICVIDSESVCFSGGTLKLQDKIKITVVEEVENAPRMGQYKWHILAYEVVGSFDQEGFHEIAAVVDTPYPGFISVVSCSIPLPTLVPYPFQITRHSLVMGTVKPLRAHFSPVVKGDQYMILKDFDREEANPSMRLGEFCLFNVRKLGPDEERMVETNCREIVDLQYKEAELYIRDPYIAVSRLEQFLQSESARFTTVMVPGTGQQGKSYKITVSLDKEQTDKCIISQSQSTWRVGSELSLRHRDLFSLVGKMGNTKMFHEGGVLVEAIKKSPDGTSTVHLRPAPRSSDLFNLLSRINFTFSDGLFTVGGSDLPSNTIAENLEIHFKRFFENKVLFDAWRGCAEADPTPIPNLHEEFRVNECLLDASQTVALRTAISKKGFTCVEAPPGSGKTFLIASIVALKKEEKRKEWEGRICVSAVTNCAITNALEVTHKQFEDISKTRQYSKMAEGSLSEESSKISLLHMAMSPQNHVDITKHKRLAKSLQNYERCTEALGTQSDVHKGLKKVERVKEAQNNLKQSFLQAYCPFLIGSTCELVARRQSQTEEQVALKIKEGRDVAKDTCITHLILDEASQIPPHMALAVYVNLPVVSRITLIGDSKQLPPYTQLEEGSLAQKLIGRGEMERLQEGKGTNRTQLETIYRCHPRIMDLLLKPIYGPQLTVGTKAIDRNLAVEADLPRAADPESSPVLFVHVDGQCERGYNPQEAEVVLMFVDDLKTKGITGEDVAIVCNHRAQREFICNKLKGQGDIGIMNLPVGVHTVDSFQGKEAKVVLVLTTKTCTSPWEMPLKVLSFVAHPNRGTVAVSRSQHAVYIFGQWDKLVQTEFWGKFVPSIVENKALVNCNWEQASDDLYDKVKNPPQPMSKRDVKKAQKAFFKTNSPRNQKPSPSPHRTESTTKIVSEMKNMKFEEI